MQGVQLEGFPTRVEFVNWIKKNGIKHLVSSYI